MTELIDIDALLNADELRNLPILDVRSPGEFGQGHIPGAINIPLFDDQQRAEIGTLYKKSGRQRAIVRGLEIVGEKAAEIVKEVSRAGIDTDCVVHCWRGGMRSEGFAWLLSGCEYKAHRVVGGYKAFRQAAHKCFAESRRVIILAGASGAGKTRLLSTLKDAGQQIVDLEDLACHRGSAFGGIEQPDQPSVEQFENKLFMQWRELDPHRPVWIESESQSIGSVSIPKPVWNQMASAPAVYLEVPHESRVEFLVGEYGTFPTEQLVAAMHKIAKRLDGVEIKKAITSLEQNDVQTFASIALDYYDKSYARSLARRPFEHMRTIQLNKAGHIDSIDELTHAADELLEVSLHAQC